jgi:hypothetical protein
MAEIRKDLGEYREIIDFANNPNVYMFYKHINAGLSAFTNMQQTTDESINKFLFMLRIAEIYLAQEYEFNFANFRKELQGTETEKIQEEIKKIAELLSQTQVKKKIILRIYKREEKKNGEGGGEQK